MDIPAHIRDSSNPRPRRGHRLRRLSVSACVFRLEQRQQGAGDAAGAFTGFFGFVEQVEDAQRSDRRLQTGAGGVEQIFAGCAAVQVEGGAAGMLVALRGASQGDEGGRGLCGDGFARTRCRSGKVRSASQNAKQRASASHRQHAIALNGRFDSSSCGDAVLGSSASPPTPETLCPTAFSCSSWP
ncbi:Uncharacterised protein [Acinetobacter baumannii]|nr:Uncharacterised protein [Acinetobacter baumannii]